MMRETRTFCYELAGYGSRYADPIQIRRDLLIASGGQVWQWAAEARALQDQMSVALEGDQRAILAVRLAETEGRLAAAAYQAFDLPPVNPNTGAGVPEEEMAAILKGFLGYAEGKG